MQVGMIGLGRMGANMVRRLMRGGHECVVHDVSPVAVESLGREGAVAAASLGAFVECLGRPRTVWLMVPAAMVDPTLEQLVPRLAAGDVVVDGGNSYYRDDVDRAKRLATRTPLRRLRDERGSVGLERGYCLTRTASSPRCGSSSAATRRRGPAHEPPGVGGGEMSLQVWEMEI
jgi:6-phosphogluconate dehydrogenase